MNKFSLKNIKSNFKSQLNKLPYIKGLYAENLQYKSNSNVPAGHFYSPIVLIEDIKKRENEIWESREIDGIPAINLNTDNQIKLVHSFEKFYDEIPFKDDKQPNLRYQFENVYYSYTDAITLYSIIREYKPNRIIEIGSGFSSAVMMDTNELFFDNKINLTFIEPYPVRLGSLMSETDKKSTTIIESDVQSVSLDVFEKLEANDILFIDSTHVSKTGSDVNYILFQILPVLKKGVLVHFHDVFYPFEYPKDWVYKGFSWNEDYILRAFLMYNETFEIKLFSEYLHKHHPTSFEKLPLCYKNWGGNLWIEKK